MAVQRFIGFSHFFLLITIVEWVGAIKISILGYCLYM